MKKFLFFLLVFQIPFILFCQNVEVEGGFIADSIDVSTGLIKNVADPVNPQDAATKAYVDLLNTKLALLTNILIEEGIVDIVEDIDGNMYNTINIGDQIWIAENLRTTRYNDGTPIPNVQDALAWSTLVTPGFCYYDTIGSNYSTYSQDTFGFLYNHYAVSESNSLNVCPVGWHVPTDGDWTILTTFLGGTSVGGGHMKETGTTHWFSPNIGATNVSGFTALPGGRRALNGTFELIGDSGFWQSSTASSTTLAYNRFIFFGSANVIKNNIYKYQAFSVRCLMD